MVKPLPTRAVTLETIPWLCIRHIGFMRDDANHSRRHQLNEGISHAEDAVVEAHLATDDIFCGTR